MDYKFGYTACYIQDHPFQHICDIPEDVALLWINKYIKPGTWINKQFVIVGGDHGKYLAVYNSDFRWSIYLQTEMNSAKKSDKELKKLYEEKIEALLKHSKVLKETLPGSIAFNDFNELPEVRELISELQKEGITKTWLAENGFAITSIILKF